MQGQHFPRTWVAGSQRLMQPYCRFALQQLGLRTVTKGRMESLGQEVPGDGFATALVVIDRRVASDAEQPGGERGAANAVARKSV